MAISYIVFDLEWNQSPRGKVGKLPDLPSEIIEVGAVKLDENLETVSEFSRFVRPFIYKKLDYRVRALTNIQTGQLQKEGKAFAQVMREFFHWCGMDSGEEVIFCSWGNMDLLELQRNLHFFHVRNPFSYPLFYYDVQKLYGRCFPDAEKRQRRSRQLWRRWDLRRKEPFIAQLRMRAIRRKCFSSFPLRR